MSPQECARRLWLDLAAPESDTDLRRLLLLPGSLPGPLFESVVIRTLRYAIRFQQDELGVADREVARLVDQVAGNCVDLLDGSTLRVVRAQIQELVHLGLPQRSDGFRVKLDGRVLFVRKRVHFQAVLFSPM